MSRRARPAATAAAATGLYLLLTIALTWPLAAGLGRDVPADLGDPLLNMWVLAWDAEQFLAILAGDIGRVARFFDANIFHPAPLSLAYSEHLVAQALQILPVYAVTRDPILSYNLLFLSTFVLSGLGGFVLVRELSGSARAGFMAGLLFAFAMFRWTQLSHMQVLSAQWMPFALYGLRRYFDTGRIRALAGATAALVAQNLSCGYYLLYFTPAAAVFVAWEIAVRRRWRSRRLWIHLAAAAFVGAVATAPFLVPYKQLRQQLGLARDTTEVVRFSADVYSYFTSPPTSPLWRPLADVHPKPEGHLFPGLVPLALALAGVVLAARRQPQIPVSASPRAPRWALAVIAATGLIYALLAAIVVFVRRIDLDLGLTTLRATDVTRLIVPALGAAVAILWLWPAARARAAAAARRPEAIMLTIAVGAWWLSLGPAPSVLGRPLELVAPYRVLHEHVPGFDGVRVPARFAMIVAFALSMLGGLAIAHLDRFRGATAATIVLAAAFLVETHLPPLALNGVPTVRGLATPAARVYRPARAPAVYHALASTGADAVVLEMPFGHPGYDVRSVYYSTAHWRRLVNGYSGFFPPHYGDAIATISAGTRGDDLAWRALQRLGVTHVVVHLSAYLDDEGARFAGWLQAHGAREMFRDERDVLLALP